MILTSKSKVCCRYTSQGQEGFSLIETAIALVTLAICLAYAMPLFLYAKVNNAKSEVRTGALIVAQRTFDNIRSRALTDLPSNDGENDRNLTGCTNIQARLPDITGCMNAATAPNPQLIPANVNAATPAEELLTKVMGRRYQVKITYCENVDLNPDICSDNFRRFRVEVFKNDGQTRVYDLESTYTRFD